MHHDLLSPPPVFSRFLSWLCQRTFHRVKISDRRWPRRPSLPSQPRQQHENQIKTKTQLKYKKRGKKNNNTLPSSDLRVPLLSSFTPIKKIITMVLLKNRFGCCSLNAFLFDLCLYLFYPTVTCVNLFARLFRPTTEERRRRAEDDPCYQVTPRILGTEAKWRLISLWHLLMEPVHAFNFPQVCKSLTPKCIY